MFVVGKGGVGRSTVAAALALRAASAGRRVLLVDVVASGGAAVALSWPGPRPRPGRVTVVPGTGPGSLHLLELSTEVALEEYVRLNLRLPGVRNLGPLARILDYVATAAPAVREIVTIGKIGYEVRERHWDQVVVDAPATGHVVELFSAPDALRPLVGRGPLADDTVWLAALLGDPTVARSVAVTLPEELVVTETLELVARIRAETPVTVAGVIANRIPPAVGRPGAAEARRLMAAGHPVGPVATLAVERHRSWGRQQDRLAPLELPLAEVDDRPDGPVAAVTASLDEAGW